MARVVRSLCVRPDGHPLQFLPEEQRGILGSLTTNTYQHVRTMVMRLLGT